jgi:hypothetical protein
MSFRLRRLLRRLRGGKVARNAGVTASSSAAAASLTVEDVEELFERKRKRSKGQEVPPAGFAALAMRV